MDASLLRKRYSNRDKEKPDGHGLIAIFLYG